MPPKLPDKRKVFEALVAEAPSVFLHLDPRRDNVRVPAHFRNNPMLVLEIGMNMRVPIPDLDIDERGVNCTLSFGGRPFWCSIPWTSVFTIVASDKRGMAWPSDVPREVAQAMKTQAEPPKPAQK
ncbi:MAG: ClpXP protease specificity-enhancing factor SspB, partial [Polyangiaceae bacterium]|nr:ClpXP protease specificity-enhancing factor SspB [Polyangiaceae bacterium]